MQNYLLIRKLRRQNGWEQRELAALVGLTPQAISDRERGRSPIRESEYPAFAKAFGVPFTQFQRSIEGLAETAIDLTAIPILNRAPASAAWNYAEHPVTDRPGYAYAPRLAEEVGMELFAIEVAEDSMEPETRLGDVIVFWTIAPGVPLKSIDGKIVFVSYKDGRGDSIALLQLQSEADPVRGQLARLAKINPAAESVDIWTSEVSRIAAGRRLHRPL